MPMRSQLLLSLYLGLTLDLVHLVHLVEGHGIFLSPKSRAQVSQENGYMQDATTIISEPMPDVVEGREYPGGRPFAEPGISISNVGPCGMETYDSLQTNWNKPEHGWGIDPVATYNAGDIVDVEWCVSDVADHGGVYSYRLCQNDSLVAKFIDPQHTPTDSEMKLLEECFQDGVLKCSDVPGQECNIHPDCEGTGWGCDSQKTADTWFNCGPKDGGRCSAKSVGKCTTHGGSGSILRDQILMPKHISNHTLLGFRWDCEDTGQLWLHCADIKLV